WGRALAAGSARRGELCPDRNGQRAGGRTWSSRVLPGLRPTPAPPTCGPRQSPGTAPRRRSATPGSAPAAVPVSAPLPVYATHDRGEDHRLACRRPLRVLVLLALCRRRVREHPEGR